MASTGTTTNSTSRMGLMKRLLVGRAVASSGLEHTLLPKLLALPVFSSDALSSVAYATEEILAVLLVATVASTAQRVLMPIAIAIAALLIIVVLSYRQTVRAYPGGGGSYIVTKENLGVTPGLIAAAALLTDYILTVSVSVTAGVYAIVSALPVLANHKVEVALGFVLLITLANLRGVKEAGTLFAVPTYGFLLAISAMLITGLVRCFGGCPQVEMVAGAEHAAQAAGGLAIFVILRAFSSGATALTGVEAIADGVPAFRRPQAKNAAQTLAIMGTISVTMFLGISFLASRMGAVVSEERTVVAQIAHATFGGGLGFYVVQILTTAILVLAANTSYQDFPRLSSILARDRFLPRQFMNRGDRLVFSNGVILLTAVAGLLIIIFDANLTRLIQLYVVGVFTSFTLSQSGMVRRWQRIGREDDAPKGWRRSMTINIIGASVTGVVLVVVTATKFVHGAWIVIAAIPLIIFMFKSIERHYRSVSEQLAKEMTLPNASGVNKVVLVVSGVSRATAEALGYAKSFRPAELHAVHYARSGAVAESVARDWSSLVADLPLQAVQGASISEAVRSYVETIETGPDDFITVVVPEIITGGLLSYVVRRRELIRLKSDMLTVPRVTVADVPVWIEKGEQEQPEGLRPLIPQRSVTLVFVSRVTEATVRAVNYARSLGASETRAITFELDPEGVERIEMEWFDRRLGIPLDVVEAPFRDLAQPMLDEVRRYSDDPNTLVTVVMPELIVHKWRHMLLHNQSALFVKRLLLFEDRVILASVPFVLEPDRKKVPASTAAEL